MLVKCSAGNPAACAHSNYAEPKMVIKYSAGNPPACAQPLDGDNADKGKDDRHYTETMLTKAKTIGRGNTAAAPEAAHTKQFLKQG